MWDILSAGQCSRIYQLLQKKKKKRKNEEEEEGETQLNGAK